ncbi:hypothetical protein N9L47_04740 [Rhodobacteraceae bacterium]|nr:hypothetical protein [Paracoccaceae bacterium]
MRNFGLISTTVWQSERFASLASLDARLAYIWLHTSAKTCAGVLRIGPAHLLEEVDFVTTLERASAIFTELADAGLISWIRPYVMIQKYLSFNSVKSYKHAIGAFKEVLAMPDCEAKASLLHELQKHKGAIDLAAWRNKSGEPHDVLFDIYSYLSDHPDTLDTPSKPYGNPSGISTNEIKKENAERKTLGDPEIPEDIPALSQARASEALRSEADPKGSAQVLPLEATKRSALAMGGR